VPVLRIYAMKRVLNNPFIPQIRCTKRWPEDFRPPALAMQQGKLQEAEKRYREALA